MTKPTGRPRGRPRKHPLPEDVAGEATVSTTATVEESEETVIEERISELEAELAGLEGPPPPLTATDIAQGAVALVDKHEQRRSTIERLEDLEAQRIELQEERGRARADWGDANTRAESKAQHIRAIDREIRELRGGGGTA